MPPNVQSVTIPTGGVWGYAATLDPQQDSSTHQLIGGGGGGANALDTYIVRDLSGNNNVNDIPVATIHGYGTLAARPGSAFEGYLYYATDTQVTFRWTSGAWVSEPVNGLPSPVGAAGKAVVSDDGTNAAWNYPQYDGQSIVMRSSTALGVTFPRFAQGGAGSFIISTGALNVTPVWLPKGILLTSITFCSASGAIVSPTHQIFGLYDNTKALLRQTTDDTNTAWAATATKTLNLTSTFTTTYTGQYWLAIMCVFTPTFSIAATATVNGGIIAIGTAANGTTSDSGLTTTLPNPFGTITQGATLPYAQVQ